MLSTKEKVKSKKAKVFQLIFKKLRKQVGYFIFDSLLKINVPVIVAILFVIPLQTFCQVISDKPESQRAYQAIQELKNGVLILRLNSEKEKLEKIEIMIQSTTLEAKDRARLERISKETIWVRDQQNTALVKAFRKFYSFSDVLFLFDFNVPELKSPGSKPLFLNDLLETDSSKNLADRPYYIVSFGRRLNSPTASEVEGLLVVDKNIVEMEKPFPFFVNQVKSLFQPPHSESYYQKLLTKFNRALSRFYEMSKQPNP